MPKYTFTALPAPRFSPVTVTLVPPDSGPRPGVSVSIEGVCEQHKFTEESFYIRVAEQQDGVDRIFAIIYYKCISTNLNLNPDYRVRMLACI